MHSLMPSGPASAGSSYYDASKPHSAGGSSLHGPFALNRQGSNSSLASSGGIMRPSSSSRRYDPYNSASTSPRATTAGSMHIRRQSQPMILPPGGLASGSTAGGPGSEYFPSPTYELKPPISPNMDPSHDPHATAHAQQTYSYPPTVGTPSSFSEFGTFGSTAQQLASPGGYAPTYTAWHQPSPSSIGRVLHSSGGGGGGGGDANMGEHSQSHSHSHSYSPHTSQPPHSSHGASQSGNQQTLGMMIQPNADTTGLDDPSWPSGDDPSGLGGSAQGTGMGMISPVISSQHHHHHHHPHAHTHAHTHAPGQLPQGWEGQYVGDNGDWRGQGTSVG